MIILGFKKFRNFFHFSAFVKWVSTFFIIVCVTFVAFNNFGENSKAIFSNVPTITWSSAREGFVTFFFFFLGFETYATITHNVKNPKKTIGKSIILVLLLSTIFYLLISFLIVVGLRDFSGIDNPVNFIVSKLTREIGVIILIIAILSLKLNAVSQSSLYAAAMLEPLAIEGYISEKLAKLNKDRVAVRASIFHIITSVIFSFIFLIVPFLVTRSTVSYASVIEFSVILMVVVHLFVLLSAIKLSLKRLIKRN